MDQPSEQLADRYSLQLNPSWRRWFDASMELPLPGPFRYPLSTAELLHSAPAAIWPGFMLPDTLPILGNRYGDWICVRVDETGCFGELIHWYHGGGDWIPVGSSIEQAVLHDAIDQFRPVQPQMLRGAGETLVADHLEKVYDELARSEFRQWLAQGLAEPPTTIDGDFQPLLDGLAYESYLAALRWLRARGWAVEVSTCDLIESMLQTAASALARASTSVALPEDPQRLAQSLFDQEHFITPENIARCGDDWQPVDWPEIEALCGSVWQRRRDLAWAADLLGWCHQRRGDVDSAAAIYFTGRMASSFTNQAVRLRTHWFDQRLGKFCIAQWYELKGHELMGQADQAPQADDYLAQYQNASSGLLEPVTRYWQSQAEQHVMAGDFAEAYRAYYQAGWDLGAPSIQHYDQILRGMIDAAQRCGWLARAAVAQTHLRCLQRRRR